VLRRGETHRLHQDWDAAARDFDRAEELDPKLPGLHYARGKLLLDLGKLPAAKRELDQALAIEPKHVDARLTRARVLMKLHHAAAAVKDYRRVLEDSGRPEPDYYLEAADATVAAGGRNARAEALALVDKGSMRLGDPPQLALRALALETELKRYDAALARIDRLAAASPRSESWDERRGDVLRQAGREQEARASYQAALDAIARLSPHRAATRATEELKARLEQKLAQAP
jgi:predicted Zn-dependent protease